MFFKANAEAASLPQKQALLFLTWCSFCFEMALNVLLIENAAGKLESRS